MVSGKNHHIRNRLAAIDGLRGLAAMGVVLYHLSANLKVDLALSLPSIINVIMSYGYLGVPIFFVISGLVISLSVGDSEITRAYAGKFIIKRSLRLDPTYWAAILFGIALIYVKNSVVTVQEPLPSISNVFFHMIYLQDILEVRPSISVVFWTLCLEVQFYLFYIFSLWLAQRYSDKKLSDFFHLYIVVSIGVYSILVDRGLFSMSINGLFVSNWHYFLIGVLVGNVFRAKQYSLTVLFSWLFFECITSVYFGLKPYQVAGVLIGFFLYFIYSKSLMNVVFTSSFLQYLGRISYTLYLIHPDIGWKFISACKMFFPGALPYYFSPLILLGGVLASIVVAHIFHLLFEQPSLRLIEKLKREKVL